MDLHSLRHRYALISIVLGTMVLLTAISGNYLLSHTRKAAAANIENRHMLLGRSRIIRNNVWQAREVISHFLIDPERVENRELIHNNIGEAINSTERLLAQEGALNDQQRAQMQRVASLLAILDSSAAQLIKVRLDTNLQYPSMVLARDQLLPRQQLVFDSFAAAIRESAEQVSASKRHFELYDALMNARHRWSQIISNVRLLIASRIGSYGLGSVDDQQKNIEMYFANFMAQMGELKQIQDEAYIGFTTYSAIDEIIEYSTQWHTHYQHLLEIHVSETWRGDIQYLRNQIDPLLTNIWHELLTFDAALEKSADEDVSMLSALALQQTYAIWGIAIIGILFVIIGFFSFEGAVLRPMSMLARALSEEATGGKQARLPDTNSTETRKLINAFVEMRKQIYNRQEALEHQALHDSLTGLANRKLLYEKLVTTLQRHSRHDDHIALIMIDLDRFKEINDALGHQIGDQLLVAASARLQGLLREQDMIARLGGDEFAILLLHAGEDEAHSVCRKILKAFETTFDIFEHQLFVGISLGVAIHPQHGLDAETLIKHADVAMYIAKRNRLGYTLYESASDNNDDRYLALANDLRAALADEQLDVVYQLKFDVASQEAVGVEALLRWNHPVLGYIPPMQIIPIAEQLGIINRLTQWVLQQALHHCARWRARGVYLNVAVNLSVYDLQLADIVNHIDTLLADNDVPPGYLTIEITESAMLIDPTHAIEILQKLDAMGIRIAIDDFGTGFSSLSYLKRLPVDELKIDKSFVMDMINNENDAVIVRSTIDLAHNLGLQVVAEGVESREILDMLGILRCDTAQGFYLARPVAADEILRKALPVMKADSLQG